MDSYQCPELLGDRIIFLISELLCSCSEFIGTPTELAQRIDPDGTEGVTPKNVSRKILQSVAALSEIGITAVVRRSNGKRLVELHRADSADTAGAGNIVPVDPLVSWPSCQPVCGPVSALAVQGGNIPALRAGGSVRPQWASVGSTQFRATQKRPVGADAYPLG